MTRGLVLPSVLLLLAARPVTAQVLHDRAVGGIVGLSFSKAGGSDAAAGNKALYGYGFGAFATFGFTRLLALEPQGLLVEKGFKTEASGLTRSVKINYIQIPLFAKLRFGSAEAGTRRVVPFVFGGPAIALRVGCRLSLKQGGNSLDGGCNTSEETGKLSSFDSSVIAGVGADIGRATVSIRYDHGLSLIDKSANPSNIKNRTILLLAGARFQSP